MFQLYLTRTISSSLFLIFIGADYHIDGGMAVPVYEVSKTNGREDWRPLTVNRRSKDFDSAEDIVWLNPGVLSNLEEFFENLSSKVGEKNDVDIDIHDSPFKNTVIDHQLQGYKPSYKIRNYVQAPEPILLKGTDRHNPSFKWTSLGKRKKRSVV